MKPTILPILLLLLPAAGFAQTELMHASDGSSITTEALIPNFKNEFGVTQTGMIILLAGNVAVSDIISVQAEIPYVQTKVEFSGPFGSSSSSKGSIGNTYFGLGIGRQTGVLSGDFGVRLNTFPDDNMPASLSGIFGDMPNVDRYIVRTTTLQAGLNFQPQVTNNLTLLVRFAPSYWIEKEGSDNMWFSRYGLGAAYQYEMIRIGAGVNGLWKMSKEGFLFGHKDALHHFQAEINARFGMFRPGIMVRVPLDKELDVMQSTIGISVGVLF